MAPFEGLSSIAPTAPDPPVVLVNSLEDEGSLEEVKDSADLHPDSPFAKDSKDRDAVPELFTGEFEDPDKIIKSGADAAQYMLSDRDDGDPAITVRSMVLGTAFAAFYASISQIYKVNSDCRVVRYHHC
jgi:hypothetical protein